MREELSDLVHRYAALVDNREMKAAAALFAADGTLVVPDPPDVLDPVLEHRGRADIIAALEAIPRTFHALVGEVFDVDGADRARGRIACVAHHLLDPSTDLVWHLRYADTYVRVDARWRIERRELHLHQIEVRPLRRSSG